MGWRHGAPRRWMVNDFRSQFRPSLLKGPAIHSRPGGGEGRVGRGGGQSKYLFLTLKIKLSSGHAIAL